MEIKEAVIVSYARTAFTRANKGLLKDTRPDTDITIGTDIETGMILWARQHIISTSPAKQNSNLNATSNQEARNTDNNIQHHVLGESAKNSLRINSQLVTHFIHENAVDICSYMTKECSISYTRSID